MAAIQIFCDGACSGNPGPMGLGMVLVSGPHRKTLSLPVGPGTNQKAELLAAVEGLKALRELAPAHVALTTDSRYVVGILTQGWVSRDNAGLATQLRSLAGKCRSFEARWEPRKSSPELQEADRLARQAARLGLDQAQESSIAGER